MEWEVEIRFRPGAYDAHGHEVWREAQDLGLAAVEAVESARLFYLDTDAPPEEVERLAAELLTDPVVERYALSDGRARRRDPRPAVTVRRKPGVMDPVALSTVQAAADMGIAIRRCATARRYYFEGSPRREDLERLARAVLANAVIEEVAFDGPAGSVFRDAPPYTFRLVHVPLRDADDEELLAISRRGGLFLNLREMQAIRDSKRSPRRGRSTASTRP